MSRSRSSLARSSTPTALAEGASAHTLVEEINRDDLTRLRWVPPVELYPVYFEKRSFSSSGSRRSLTQRRSAMTKGSRFRRASKSATRRVRSSQVVSAGMAVVIRDVLAQPVPERLNGHQIRAVARQRHQGDVQGRRGLPDRLGPVIGRAVPEHDQRLIGELGP